MGEHWSQSRERVAFHEIGHAVVDYERFGIASECVVAQIDGEWIGQTPPLPIKTPIVEMTRQQQLDFTAGLFGGWAAVHLAIKSGLLPSEPAGVEEVAGDRGYHGDANSDARLVARISEIADPDDPAGFAESARALALDTLCDRMTVVAELAAQLGDLGMLCSDDLAAALST